jgi:hypothetical protein
LPSATTSFVCAPLIAHGQNPPCDHLRARRCRVHRIPSRVRDDRDTPLWGTGRIGLYSYMRFCQAVQRRSSANARGHFGGAFRRRRQDQVGACSPPALRMRSISG